jgi:CRP-like cAMP-binding protein
MKSAQATTEVLCASKMWLGRADCKHCDVRNSDLFSALTNAELESMPESIDVYCYPAGSILYQEGEKNGSVYVMRAGLVKLIRELPDGTCRIVRLMRRGDTFGLEHFLGKVNGHTAVTVTGANLCRIPISLIKSLYRNNPNLCGQLLERWDDYLRRADNNIAFLSTGTTRKRVVNLIQYLAAAYRQRDVNRVALLSREDMASVLGVRVEGVSRIIAELKRDGVLRPIGKGFYEYDPIALGQLAEV